MKEILLYALDVEYDHVQEVYRIKFFDSKKAKYCGEVFADKSMLMDYFRTKSDIHELSKEQLDEWRDYETKKLQELFDSGAKIVIPFSFRKDKRKLRY